ncbi:hypothetical protein PIB30_079379 [Stylosanthes scabra]|uniref:RING-type E3 ubiquitin transferase n=1 Tax=Stylosanthes scabra TaxID=79078 RepID=A0ABU6ZQD1_9FABA|nr:hypothetical protein [Stylosanthes scabra]
MWRELEYGRGRIAVAVDNKEPSKLALNWVINRNFVGIHPIKLIHVVQTPPTGIQRPQSDDEVMEMLIPHRNYCTERNVQYEIVIVRDENVAAGIIEYVSSQIEIRILVLGSSSKRSRKGNALSRIFKTKKNNNGEEDVETTVLKWLPPQCRVYVTYKGNITSSWHALAAQRYRYRRAPLLNHNPNPSPVRFNNYTEIDDDLDDEINKPPPLTSGNQSPDNNDCISFYENLQSGFTLAGSYSSDDDDDEPLILSCSNQGPSSFFQQSLDKMEDKLIRQQVVGPKKAIMELYHQVCGEAQISKQELNELQGCNMEQEQTMKEAESEELLTSEAQNLWNFIELGLQEGADVVQQRRDQLALSQIHQGVDYTNYKEPWKATSVEYWRRQKNQPEKP